MHKIYFTRHGETVWNVENKICGMTDSPLTERGRQQARQLGERVKASGVHIDEILYSPLSRAADTAKAIADATGLPARCEPRLREQCFGKYEGTPRNGGEFRVSKTHFADRYDGGESMMQLAQRIYNLLDELKADTGKTYLLVAHNGIARVVQSYFYDMTNEEYAAAGIKTANWWNTILSDVSGNIIFIICSSETTAVVSELLFHRSGRTGQMHLFCCATAAGRQRQDAVYLHDLPREK